jgi:hypothetical protein
MDLEKLLAIPCGIPAGSGNYHLGLGVSQQLLTVGVSARTKGNAGASPFWVQTEAEPRALPPELAATRV